MNSACFREIAGIVIVSIGLTTGRSGFAAEPSCPIADDVRYSTQAGDTWYSLATRAYCLNGDGASTRGAQALYEYNRGRAEFDMPQGVSICVPRYLHGPAFDANRCRTMGSPELDKTDGPESSSSVEPHCGNDRREVGELCDGRDLGGETCTAFNLPAGKLVCRLDCRGFDAGGCVPPSKPPDIPPIVSVRDPSPFRERDKPVVKSAPDRLSLELGGGLLVPAAERTRSILFGPIGIGRAGIRIKMGFAEMGIHGYFGGTRESLEGDAIVPLRTSLFGGAGLQMGVPIAVGHTRWLPGIEALALAGQQTLEWPTAFNQKAMTKPRTLSLLGLTLRGEYRFSRPRVAPYLEFGAGVVPQRIETLSWLDNVQLRIMGGLSHVAF